MSYPFVPSYSNALVHLEAPIFRRAVDEACVNINAPRGLAIFSALAVMSLALQDIIEIETPYGKKIPPSLFLLPIAASGLGKSAVHDIFIKPIDEHEKAQQDVYEVAFKDWRARSDIWEKVKTTKEWKIAKLQENGMPHELEMQEYRAFLEEEPVRPRALKMKYEDATTAALFAGMHENHSSVGLMSAEGGTLFNSQALQDFPKLNKLWSNEPVTVDRISRESFTLRGGRLTILAMVQPGVLSSFLSSRGQGVRDSGFAARFLVCKVEPGPAGGIRGAFTPVWHSCDRFSDRTKYFLERNLEASKVADFRRAVVRLDPYATNQWNLFATFIESQKSIGGIYEHAWDHASKLAENALRVAALIHYFEGFSGDISVATLQVAIDICTLSSQAFLSTFVPPPEYVTDANVLYAWLKPRFEDTQSPVEKLHVLQFGPASLRRKERLDPALNELVRRKLVFLVRLSPRGRLCISGWAM